MVRFLTGMGLGLLAAGFMVIFLADTVELEKYLLPFGMTLLVVPRLIKSDIKPKTSQGNK
jgi:hypothetical protein